MSATAQTPATAELLPRHLSNSLAGRPANEETKDLSLVDAARILRMSPSRVRRMVFSGRLRGKRSSADGRWMVERRSFEAHFYANHLSQRNHPRALDAPVVSDEFSVLVDRALALSVLLGEALDRIADEAEHQNDSGHGDLALRIYRTRERIRGAAVSFPKGLLKFEVASGN